MQGIQRIDADMRNTAGVVTENRHVARNVHSWREGRTETSSSSSSMMLARFFLYEELASTPFLLVVDDSPTVRKILEVCLGREGYQMRSFRDGMELLSWLMTPEARIPQLIVVDLNLPKIDGYTLIRHLKARPAFAGTVFIILTGHSGMFEQLKGRLSGAQVYLTKPFRIDDVVATVRSCLGPPHQEQTAETTMEVAY